MEVESDTELLSRITAGELLEPAEWPSVRKYILKRLDTIAHNDFPIPNLPPPPPVAKPTELRLLSTLPSSSLEPSSSQDANKENAPIVAESADTADADAATDVPLQEQDLEPGALPVQIADLLQGIVTQIEAFDTHPPHTIQRLAELILQPRAHYRALAAYLHAVDRVVQVTSGTNTYPLPPAIPDMSGMNINGADTAADSKDPAENVAWSNSTTVAVGSDEALGGALLTPIPWLTRRSPESNGGTPGAQIHSESTETIEGPNGVGSIETVSVSVNGVPSTGHTRGVTQGELLRQEQRAGVVPVNQLPRPHASLGANDSQMQEDEEDGGSPAEDEEEETPHARGPEEIGVGDTGLQTETTSQLGESGEIEMQGIDVAAAVGRKRDDDGYVEGEARPGPDDSSKDDSTAKAAIGVDSENPDATSEDAPSPTESTGTKREAEQDLEGAPPRKVREVTADNNETDKDEEGTTIQQEEEAGDGNIMSAEKGKDEANSTAIDEPSKEPVTES